MSTPESTSSDQSDDVEPVTETWTYIGQRFNANQTVHGFLDAQGEERYFSGKVMPHPGIGGRYTVKVWYRGDRVSAGIEGALYVGMSDDTDQINRWRVDHAAVMTRREHERAEKRLAGQNGDISTLTFEEMREIMRRQPAHLRRGTLAFINDWLLR